ncbi:hypothetical protein RTBOTA2_005100 [Rhodotorula toruloides]|nr:hypothetical protein RTBOTA2_005100 [Rhodotorula toruloides]
MAAPNPAHASADSADGPRFPSTLAPDAYYEGLLDRLQTALLPTLDPFFSSLSSLSSSSSSHPLVLELASGNGTHATLFTRSYPSLSIQPTECDSFGVKRINETVARDGAERVRRAIRVDVMSDGDWEGLGRRLREEEGEGKRYDLVFGSNFLHMVPFPDAPHRIFRLLLTHSLLTPTAKLLIYGPFKSDTGFFSPSDAA